MSRPDEDREHGLSIAYLHHTGRDGDARRRLGVVWGPNTAFTELWRRKEGPHSRRVTVALLGIIWLISGYRAGHVLLTSFSFPKQTSRSRREVYSVQVVDFMSI